MSLYPFLRPRKARANDGNTIREAHCCLFGGYSTGKRSRATFHYDIDRALHRQFMAWQKPGNISQQIARRSRTLERISQSSYWFYQHYTRMVWWHRAFEYETVALYYLGQMECTVSTKDDPGVALRRVIRLCRLLRPSRWHSLMRLSWQASMSNGILIMVTMDYLSIDFMWILSSSTTGPLINRHFIGNDSRSSKMGNTQTKKSFRG